jgi:hypothetical protein
MAVVILSIIDISGVGSFYFHRQQEDEVEAMRAA